MSAAPPTNNEQAPFIARDGGGRGGAGGGGGTGGAARDGDGEGAPPLIRQRSAAETTGLRAATPFINTMTPNLVMTILIMLYWLVMMVADCIAIYYWQTYKNEFCKKGIAMMVGVFGVAQLCYIILIFLLFGLVLGYMGYAARHRMESLPGGMLGGIIAIVVFIACGALFVFVWLIVGSVWIYPDTGVQKGAEHCNTSLYNFAFWFITAQWIGCGVCIIYYCVSAFAFRTNPFGVVPGQQQA